MVKDPLIQWAESELERLDREEAMEKRRKEVEAEYLDKLERLINAPSMNIDGKIIGGKSLSTGEAQ